MIEKCRTISLNIKLNKMGLLKMIAHHYSSLIWSQLMKIRRTSSQVGYRSMEKAKVVSKMALLCFPRSLQGTWDSQTNPEDQGNQGIHPNLILRLQQVRIEKLSGVLENIQINSFYPVKIKKPRRKTHKKKKRQMKHQEANSWRVTSTLKSRILTKQILLTTNSQTVPRLLTVKPRYRF